MARSDAESPPRREPSRFDLATDRRPTARPGPAIERAFRRIVEERSQPRFEHTPGRVSA